MGMTVWVDSWQMRCCGEAFHVGSQVAWTLGLLLAAMSASPATSSTLNSKDCARQAWRWPSDR
jgi:hypothetical protein